MSTYRARYAVTDAAQHSQITVNFLSGGILAMIDQEAKSRNLARSALLRKILLEVFKDKHLLKMLAGEECATH
jgi:hypothetical protein